MLQARLYLQYGLLVLLAFPVIVAAREESIQLEVLARFERLMTLNQVLTSTSLSHLRFSIAYLVIRIASSITLATCLQLAFQQVSPCLCLVECTSSATFF